VNGIIGLRFTKESLETDEGQINRAFVPQIAPLPDGHFQDPVAGIESAIQIVSILSREICAVLRPLHEKRGTISFLIPIQLRPNPRLNHSGVISRQVRPSQVKLAELHKRRVKRAFPHQMHVEHF
jgi:hypothetical protein